MAFTLCPPARHSSMTTMSSFFVVFIPLASNGGRAKLKPRPARRGYLTQNAAFRPPETPFSPQKSLPCPLGRVSIGFALQFSKGRDSDAYSGGRQVGRR